MVTLLGSRETGSDGIINSVVFVFNLSSDI